MVNALIHRSYLETGSEVHVDMFDDCMTVHSPGGKMGKPLPVDVMAEPIASKRRKSEEALDAMLAASAATPRSECMTMEEGMALVKERMGWDKG